MRYAALALVGSSVQMVSAELPPPRAGEERVNPVDGAVMVWVPGTAEACPNGKFRMGSTQEEIDRLWAATGWSAELRERAAVEQPAHEVDLDGFWLYKHEVTVEQYAEFLAATGHVAPPAGLLDALKAHANLPMMCVGWDDAAAYCQWAQAALPTEAQWEYAARGPEQRLFPWGDHWDRELCNCSEYHAGQALDPAAQQAWWDAVPQTAEGVVEYLRPVGSFPAGASWCGALDMAGSVWEWCSDWFDRAFYGSSAACEKNPQCRTERSHDRIMRGGSWNFDVTRCRGANRNWYNPDVQLDFFGVRPVVAR